MFLYIGLDLTMRFPTTLLALAMLFAACGEKQHAPTSSMENKPVEQPLFTKVPATHSGISFQNKVEETPSLHYLIYNNLFSGAGLAVGDLNNDDLPDLYFTGNQVPDRLYINKGGLQFEDATDKAISTGRDGWHRGATIVDVDADGWNDIYVCRHGWQSDPALRTNLLYINNHDGTFTEKAAQWGLADTSHSTHAAFFDYDRDGDLDVYVINQPPERTADRKPYTIEQVRDIIQRGKAETSRLFRNEGDRFVDVTREAGVTSFAFSLGAVIVDVDNNGWPDLYVANDYSEPDFLYINDSKGHFTNEVKQRTGHVSNFGMGVDAADINNDGAIDLAVLDMAYKSMVRSKENMGAMRPDKFWGFIDAGYHYQYMINTLQLNNGNGSFSEIAQMSGVAKTDWSWAPMIEDLDNDGWNDMYITNGTTRDVRNNDANINIVKLHAETGGNAGFETALGLMPSTLVPNVCYRNEGLPSDGLHFADVTKEWGLYEPSTSHGLAVADLDRDGDLDMVMNRADAVASLFENHQQQLTANHFLRVRLEGPVKNRMGIGATVRLRQGDQQQVRLVQLGRGYQSGQEPIAHFGLGESPDGLSVEVEWPDGRWSSSSNVQYDQVLVVKWSDAQQKQPDEQRKEPLFGRVDVRGFGMLASKESNFDDFADEILLPQRYSRLGPFMSAGDVNGDGFEDLLHSGASGTATRVVLNTAGTGHTEVTSADLRRAAAAEDLGSVLFDADADGDPDLVVVAGSKEFKTGDELLKARFYANDGKGNFTFKQDALPDINVCAQRMAVGDADGDGDPDLFIGGRVEPGRYPMSPSSYLLRNDGGVFTDITAASAPALMALGMVTDARFADTDNDSDKDLVVVGEWMPVTILENRSGKFENITSTTSMDSTNGWWYSVELDDLDGDGDLDIVAGNLGLNSKYHASKEEPFHVFLNDFDQSGTYDIVLALHQDKALFPVRGRQCTSEQMPFIKEKFPTFHDFATATVPAIYSQEALDDAFHREAYELRSCVFLNDGGGRFRKMPLPMRAQASPINDILVGDMDGDGRKDLIVAGNNYDTEVETVRYDAGTGLLLTQQKDGSFRAMPPNESGLRLTGNVKDLAWITLNGERCIIAAANGEAPMVHRPFRPKEL
jgi:enediyne biosynthesis protein E4